MFCTFGSRIFHTGPAFCPTHYIFSSFPHGGRPLLGRTLSDSARQVLLEFRAYHAWGQLKLDLFRAAVKSTGFGLFRDFSASEDSCQRRFHRPRLKIR